MIAQLPNDGMLVVVATLEVRGFEIVGFDVVYLRSRRGTKSRIRINESCVSDMINDSDQEPLLLRRS